MANTKPNATQVKYKNETVYSALDRAETNITTNTNNSVRRKDYTELSAYTGPATIIDITDAGIAGRFYRRGNAAANGITHATWFDWRLGLPATRLRRLLTSHFRCLLSSSSMIYKTIHTTYGLQRWLREFAKIILKRSVSDVR